MADQPLVADYDFGAPPGAKFHLYRGDTAGPFVHKFNDPPPDWAATTAYTVGDSEHGPDETYVAGTTCTFEGDPYTCTTAHTSGAEFDDSMWAADDAALGPETDITGWAFLAQYRATTAPDAELLASDTCVITDGPGGVMTRTLDADQSDLLVVTPVKWDFQATKADDTVKTYLKNDKVKIGGDVSRAVGP